MTEQTLFWYDYETSGTHPALDRPLQVAAVRTNLALEPIEEPLSFYVRPSPDYLIHPEAALVTGISPHQLLEEGVSEAELSQRLFEELSRPGTCSVGYNSIRFDDEFTRYLFYRNLLPVYDREWQNGNSRWDLIDVVRLAHDLRPEGMHWPQRESGHADFRLEALSAANGISHEQAHDALADVYATVALAKLIRDRQPKLFDYCFEIRLKSELKKRLKPGSGELLLHTSGMYNRQEGATTVVMPLLWHPLNTNSVIVWDCRFDPQLLLDLELEELRRRLYSPKEALTDSEPRPALKELHVNKAAVVAPLNTLRDDDAVRLGIDRAAVKQHQRLLLQQQRTVERKLRSLYQQRYQPEGQFDVDQQLYHGFFEREDLRQMAILRQLTPAELAQRSVQFRDERLTELLFRFRARNYPDSLSESEMALWRAHCRQRLQHDGENPPGFSHYFALLQQLPASELRQELADYGQQLQHILAA
ncbi:exodeoxyribonuclease I [Ectothiorhodospiraceae bacterium BW-2]|nr:exodeoxyribonuclease I [Ectothiorhodospiraceae bacterium BW-2]